MLALSRPTPNRSKGLRLHHLLEVALGQLLRRLLLVNVLELATVAKGTKHGLVGHHAPIVASAH